MPSTKTPVGRPTAETIRSWRTLEDAPVLTPLAKQRRTLREHRRVLMARERERLACWRQEHQEKQRRLAHMDNKDISEYPPFDPLRVQDAAVLECRDALHAVNDELLAVDTAFEEQSSPVIAEFSAVQKTRLVQVMDRALAALDVLEEVGAAGEHLCMQSWGVLDSYLTNIALFQRMQRRDRALLQQERDRLSQEVERFYA